MKTNYDFKVRECSVELSPANSVFIIHLDYVQFVHSSWDNCDNEKLGESPSIGQSAQPIYSVLFFPD